MLLTMVIVTPAARPSHQHRSALRRRLDAMVRDPAAWYAGFALYAGCVALFSGLGQDHWWGTWAAGGYAVAALVAACRPTRGGRLAALAAALAGALAAPTAWLVTTAPATPDVVVVARSGGLLLHHGTPYLPIAQLAHGGWLAYNPYLPVMAVFGLPKALGLPGLLGDPRPWLALATFGMLYATFRVTAHGRAVGAAPRAALGLAGFALASPVLAFPLTMGITDPPIIALTCLTLALLTRPRASRWLPAVVLGVACAMKYTAWPALAVLLVMVAARDGARAALRFGGAALGTSVALVVALAPAALISPAAILRNTVAYPLGLTTAHSPAQSPLPGHILATLGPAGHAAAIALLAAAGIALAVSLVVAPPAAPPRAAWRIALGLTALFALSPATRFGYFVYPLALCGWLAVATDHASATAFRAASVAGIPVRAASNRFASWSWASSPYRCLNRVTPSGSTSQDSVTWVPPDTGVKV
jgi:phosphatidylinositol alpha-1,6-mannosyltransferase